MRRFQFQMQALFQVKLNQREILESEIMNIQSELDQLRDRLVELSEDLDSISETRMESLLKGVVGDSLLSIYESWVVLFHLMQQQEELIWEKEKLLEKKQQEHFELHSECRALEKMKEKAKQVWWRNVLAEEQKVLDEFGTQRHMRDNRES